MGLFGRKQSEERLRLYYASDIHGTEVLWRKFLRAPEVYKARVLVMGGDLTGKAVIPIVAEGPGTSVATLFGRRVEVHGEEEIAGLEEQVRANGMYPHQMTREEVDRVAALSEEEREAWFEEVMLETFAEWLALAPERLADPAVRCFVMPGNDDPQGVDGAIEAAPRIEGCDDRVVEFEGYTMLSLGYSNRTPFDSPRELEEDELARRIDALAEQVDDMGRCVFNLHVPPYDSGLDTAPELDENLTVVTVAGQPVMAPCGSRAVRDAIERYQPVLSLHGHVHESRAATHLGRTLSINPGSDYHTGRISGCLVHLQGEKVNYQFVVG
ncbi:MAG: metallophosphoesterase [Actinobacteria bacterium]|nr:metallophosphoesterase [Actinomycetota bacterium]